MFPGVLCSKKLSTIVLIDAEVGKRGGEGAEFNLYVYEYAL